MSDFDVAISKHGNRPNAEGVPQLALMLPMALATVFWERGYGRATITVTDDGLLVKPYVAASKPRTRLKTVVPEWD